MRNTTETTIHRFAGLSSFTIGRTLFVYLFWAVSSATLSFSTFTFEVPNRPSQGPSVTESTIRFTSSTDMPRLIHAFNPATDPAWEARTNWDQFKAIAQKFSELAGKHLGVRKDMVATALLHDTPGEIGQPFGEVRDWRRGDAEPVPGKTMFNLKVVERPYPDIYKMYSALGPNVAKPGGVGAKGVSWSCAPEYEQLKARLGVVSEPGVSEGMPQIGRAHV